MKTISHTKRAMPAKWRSAMNSPSEKKRRSALMRKINLTHISVKLCKLCTTPFEGRMRQTMCSKKCVLDAALLRKYGITSSTREKLKEQQKNRCAICDRVKPLVIDHCHITGRVRGLLCRVCNSSLYFFENPEILNRGLIYTTNEIKK